MSTSSLLTYADAKRRATKRNAGIVYRSDAGNGWTSEVYWCPQRRRQIWTSINPQGMRIV